MGAEPQVLDFTVGGRDVLIEQLRAYSARHRGWANLLPVIDTDGEDETPDDAPRGRAGVFAWLSSRGPALPIATWVAGEERRKGLAPDSIGIQHPAGPRALITLAQGGVALPPGWRRLSDHPKRGLVVEVPAGTDPAECLDWLLRAAEVLTPQPLPTHWRAFLHPG